MPVDKLEFLVAAIAPEAKAHGYKKVRRTWYKEKEDLTVIFSIQKSQFDAEAWYCTYGVCLRQIAKGSTHTLDVLTVTSTALRWARSRLSLCWKNGRPCMAISNC